MLLEKVNIPADIKGFSTAELKTLCEEIRAYMVECCAKNPGHLGSSLGAVELIVALHYIYNTPDDKLLFDVSHQAYAHKILTGRKDDFKTLRTFGGISGFTHRSESPYDAFVAGHASTSISAALGFATAAHLSGSPMKSVAVIGDGALTGGLAFEGLNNAGATESDILIVLNDNNISISPNIGGLHNYLLNVTTHPVYNKVKTKVWNTLGDRRFRTWIQMLTRKVKSGLVHKYKGDFFETLGFRYFGPIDGNNIEILTATLRKLHEIKGPKVLHIITKKGKGYTPAEEDPVVWHAPGKFDPETGERIVKDSPASRYQDVFGTTLTDIAALDDKVVGITPAMLTGCSMDIMADKYPQRVFDVGIEEEHAVTFSAGLAAQGYKPFCNIYSSFSQRAYDQIIHDVALQKLPVVLCFDRGGVVGEDGPTHHGAFDLAAYRSIPNTIIAAPSDEAELRSMMFTAYKHTEGPFIIRYPRGLGRGVEWRSTALVEMPVGRGRRIVGSGCGKVAVVALGPIVDNAIKAANGREDVDIYDMRFLKPFDEELIGGILRTYEKVVTIEDGCLKGGLYSEVLERKEAIEGCKAKVVGLGLPDKFIPHGKVDELWKLCGLDVESITDILSV